MTAWLRPYLGQFIAQLAAVGVKHAVIAPGSRSTPLALLLKERPDIDVMMALDERSGAYFALGLAKASSCPVVLVCTSGTAAANFMPAVAEAGLSRVPLVVLTADRPRELRDVGAAQTINQVNLYGSHVKWFVDMPAPGPDLEHHAAVTAARAVHRAMSQPRGPVHLNFPLREPLLPEEGPIGQALMAGHYAPVLLPSSDGIEAASKWIWNARFPIVALGPEAPWVSDAVLDKARNLHLPVFADPLCHNGRPAGVLTAYDTFLRSHPGFSRPDAVIRLGAPLTSKAFNQWCVGARLVLLDWPLGFRDPALLESVVVEGDPADALSSLLDRLPPTAPDFVNRLAQVEQEAQARVDFVLEKSPQDFEGRFYREVAQLWGSRAAPALAASSMPVRDFDTFYSHGGLRLMANRGANGIDGLISTAMGIARHTGDVLAVVGDLAFHHDLTGLIYGQRLGINALIVVINNDGGAIFSYLAQGQLDEDLFEELFGTPHQVDFSGVAALYGADFRRAYGYDALRSQFLELRDRPGLRVLEWRTSPRRQSAAIHRQLYQSGPLNQ